MSHALTSLKIIVATCYIVSSLQAMQDIPTNSDPHNKRKTYPNQECITQSKTNTQKHACKHHIIPTQTQYNVAMQQCFYLEDQKDSMCAKIHGRSSANHYHRLTKAEERCLYTAEHKNTAAAVAQIKELVAYNEFLNGKPPEIDTDDSDDCPDFREAERLTDTEIQVQLNAEKKGATPTDTQVPSRGMIYTFLQSTIPSSHTMKKTPQQQSNLETLYESIMFEDAEKKLQEAIRNGQPKAELSLFNGQALRLSIKKKLLPTSLIQRTAQKHTVPLLKQFLLQKPYYDRIYPLIQELVTTNNLEMMTQLKNSGLNVNWHSESATNSLLELAYRHYKNDAQNQQLKPMIKLLIDASASIRSFVEANDLEAVTLFLELGTSPHQEDIQKRTLLDDAITKQLPDMAALLKKHGAQQKA